MATTRPLDIKYGISIGGEVIIDSERNLSVENAEVKNLNVTGTLTSVNATNTLLRDNKITLNSGNAVGQITAFGTITGGSGYTQGSYKNVPLTGGTGTGATADITVNSSGVVTSVTLQFGGYGYLATDSLQVSASDIDSGTDGTNFSVEVDTVSTGASSSDAFIYVSRGSTGTDTAIKWNESSDKWQFTNDGTTYYNIPTADTNTTYNTSVVDSSGIKLRLSGSDATSDDVTFAGAGSVAVSRTDDSTITITGTDTNTTYSISAEVVTNVARLRLTDSSSNTDDVIFVGSGATTVTRSDASTITFSSTDTNTTYTQEVVSDNGIKLRLAGSDSVNDDITFQAGSNVTITTGGTSNITIAATNTDTTYAISAETSLTTDAAKLTLTAGGSGSGTDDVTFVGSNGISVTRTDANTITINGGGVTDTNTTYSISAVNDSGVKLRLTAGGSGSGTDDVTFVGSGGTSVTVANDTITISSVANTDTTYAISAETGTGGANLRLTAGGSGSGTDDVIFIGSGLTSVSRTDANTITISTTEQTLSTVTTAGNLTSNTIGVGEIKLNNGSNTTEIGNIVAKSPSALNANTATAIDTFTVSGYTTAKYLIQAIQNTSGKRQTTEILLFEDGTTVYMTEYGTITNQSNNASWIAFDASSDGTTVSLTAQVSDAATNNVTIKLIRQTIV